MKNAAVFFALFIIAFTGFISQTHTQTFTKVTTGAFVNDGGASRSVNFIDYDGDGDLDLYVSNGKRFGQKSFLYQNDAGIFTRIFNAGPVNDSLPFDGASWGDYNNDGYPDLCAVTWYDSITVLYQNNGSGTFTFLGSSAVVTNRGFSETCSWGDYDNDGMIDLFITNSSGIGTWRNRLYKNLGSGNFSAIDTGAISLDINKGSRGINWVDIDNDGDLDIFICSENNQSNLCYINNGGGYFTKMTSGVIVNDGGHKWSASWGDYDNDGDFDLFAAGQDGGNSCLYRNDGNLNFTKILSDSIVNDPGYYACSGWGDYDNDGDLDMFVTQAYITPNSPLKNHLYKNMLIETGTASFEKVITGDLVNDPGYSYGFAWGDWDADGDLDIFTAGTYGENQNNSAFINGGSSNKWIEMKLTGVNSNKSAIGTKVRVKAVINGIPRWLVRAVEGQSGYCGQNLDLHFGLGDAAVIDSIKVEWPSGLNEYFTNESTDRIIKIVEGQGIIGIHQSGTEVPEGFKLYQNYPNPFNPVTKIRFDIPALSKFQAVKIEMYNILGEKIETLLDQNLKPGSYEADWNAANYSSGIYFYKLSSGDFSVSKKMILVK